MGTLIIVICGLAGGFIAAKKNLLQPWIFLINFSVAVYLSIFLSPILTSYLPIKEIPPVLLNLLSMIICLILISILLMKIAEAVVSDTETAVDIPAIIAKPIQACSGFLAGCLVSGLLMWIICLLPYSENFAMHPVLRTQSGKVLLTTINTLNSFSLYSLTPQDQTVLKQIGVIYEPPVPSKEESAIAKPIKKTALKKKKAKKTKNEKVSPVPVTQKENKVQDTTPAPQKQEKQDKIKSVIPALDEVQIEQALSDDNFSKTEKPKNKKKKKVVVEQTDELDEFSFD